MSDREESGSPEPRSKIEEDLESDEEVKTIKSEEVDKTQDNVEDEDDEEEEEEEEEEEDDDEEDVRQRKKPRRERRNQFLDVEAEVDEDEEDLEEDEDGLIGEDGFVAEPDADEPDASDDRFHREMDRRREAIAEEDAERLADEYREKYGRSTANKYRGDSGVIPQHLLLPSVNEPSIWGIRCKPGKEKELVRQCLRKKLSLQKSRNPLKIMSVFQRDTFTGYIYMEARNQQAVTVALKGLVNVYPQNMILVPIKEYVDLLRATKSAETELVPGAYVRLKRGKYGGDLAIVENLSENGLEVRLKLVPRLDYGRNAEAGIDGKRKRVARIPPPRLFSEQEASQYDPRNLQKRGPNAYVYAGDEYIGGFLYKDFKITLVNAENVAPKLEELTRFNSEETDGIDLASLAQSLRKSAAAVQFQGGDVVEVSEGEQTGVQGTVISTHGDIVTVEATTAPLVGKRIDLPSRSLRKKFAIGDHVRVISGNFLDDTGLIVGLEDDSVTLLSDLNKKEVTVFAKDLKKVSDIGGSHQVGDYELHDFVQLDALHVGCIVKVERDSLKVLDQEGTVRSVTPSSITMKLTRNMEGLATDSNGSEIKIGDTVRETVGEGRQGAVLHIYKNTLFLSSRSLGVFVAKAFKVNTIVAKGARTQSNSQATGPDLTKMNPAVYNARPGQMAPPVMPKQGGFDRLKGKHVAIGPGSQHKGCKGIVKETTDDIARVELHAPCKVVNVLKHQLRIYDDYKKTYLSYMEFATPRGMRSGGGRPGGPPGPGGPGSGGQTPSWGGGGKTPSWGAGGKTPSWGSKTPSWGGAKTSSWGSRTPAANAGGAQTPAWGAMGNKTPSWGASESRTPAWGGAKTPAWGAAGAGSKTPAFGVARTPSWKSSSAGTYGGSSSRNKGWEDLGSGNSAPTPGYAAATPGEMMGAPTPGAAHHPWEDSAPTPAAYNDARTPGVYDPRGSGPAQAETPAAWSTDDAPRYDDSPTP